MAVETLKLSSLSLYPSPQEVFGDLKKNTIIQLAKGLHMEISDKVSRKKIVKNFLELVETYAAKQLTRRLRKEELVAVVAPLKIDHQDNNPNSTPVLQKRLAEALTEEGIQAFLENAPSKTINIFCAAMEIEPEKGDSNLNKLVALIKNLGLQFFFEKFDIDTLVGCARDLGVVIGTTKKSKIALALATQDKKVAKEPENRPKTEIKFSKTKKPIKPGIGYHDIYQHYYETEIRDWCKEQGLKTSGTKKVLIKRILAFLDGDKENTVSRKSDTNVTKKKTSDSKKDAESSDSESEEESSDEESSESESEKDEKPEDKKDDKADKTKNTDEKPEPVAQPMEVPESVEKEEVQKVELDFNKLSSYKKDDLIAFLKQNKAELKGDETKDVLIKKVKKFKPQ